MAGGIDGPALGSIAAGGLFLYAAVKGKSVLGTVQALVKGTSPSTAPAANTITGSTSSASATSSSAAPVAAAASGSAQAALQNAAAAYGWNTGAQWQALQSIEMGEAGFNPTIKNPSSGALGLAQALGHGNGAATAGTLGNEYGGYGLTDAQAQAANSGNADAQAAWMVDYIAATYGNPANAYSKWLSRSPHWY